MSGGSPRSSDGPGGGDLQLVVASTASASSASALVAARAVGGGAKEGALVEYKKPGPLLREDEEDLEIKLRRIIDNVPVKVSNTSGSSAGSGSGDFHQYRQMRRKEQDRIARMEADYQKRKEIAEFDMRREERMKAAEERTAKKRLKRQKKKQKKKEKKTKTSVGDGEEHQGEENHKEESSDSEDSDYDDSEQLQLKLSSSDKIH